MVRNGPGSILNKAAKPYLSTYSYEIQHRSQREKERERESRAGHGPGSMLNKAAKPYFQGTPKKFNIDQRARLRLEMDLGDWFWAQPGKTCTRLWTWNPRSDGT